MMAAKTQRAAIIVSISLLHKEPGQPAPLGKEYVSDEYAGDIIAAAAKNYGMISVLNELFTSKYGNQFFKLEITESWLGKTVMDLFIWLKKNYNALLISVEQSNDQNNIKVSVNPEKDYRFNISSHFLIIISAVNPNFSINMPPGAEAP